MIILVVSDTHGRHDNLQKILPRVKPDLMYHLGDAQGMEDLIEGMYDCPMEFVRGNCDFGTDLPGELILPVKGHHMLLCHGHAHSVKYGTHELVRYAKERECDVALYGHTHCPEIYEEDGITIMNPGSISLPRQMNGKPSYGIIRVEEDGSLGFSICYVPDF